ncbi:MAG: insulinase family protein [Myxococcales bacterium]|nr:insulinase family protein [Myxococcales bacterium]
MQVWVSVGSADESAKQAGLSHVMEHMLFKGTERRGVGEVSRDIESAGGEINAWTSRDNTVFHLVMPSRLADVGIDVLSDVLQNSLFDTDELEREREVILEEIRQGKDEPLRALAQNMFSGAFEHHPYRNPVIGNEATVEKFTRGDLVRFRDRWYGARNMALVVSGDFDPDTMKSKLAKSFAGLSGGPNPRRRRAKATAPVGKALLSTGALSHSQVALAFRAPRVDSPDCAALDLLTIALGQGESSLLSSELVRERELCRSAYSYLHALQDHSLVVVGAASDADKMSKALPHLGRLLQRVRTELISAEDLAKAKRAIEADKVYQQQTAEGAAQVAGSYLALTGDADFERSYLRRISSLTAEDLRDVALRVFDPKSMNLAALVPPNKALLRSAGRVTAAGRMMLLIQKGVASKPAKQKSNARKQPTVLRHQFDNGMNVLIKRDTSVPLVAARAIWSGGTLREQAANSGISSIMAQVITQGCGRMSAEEIIEEIDSTAASLSGFSGRNSFGLQAEWLAGDWKRGLDLLSECMLSPHFDAAEVERSKRQQLSRLQSQADSPSHQVFRLFQETLFRKHAYRRNSLGTADSIARVDAEAVRRHYQRHYPVSALTLSIVGDVDPEILLARIESRFASEPSTQRPERPAATEMLASRPASKREVYGYMDREQAHLVVGFPGLRINDRDRFALEVLTTILGGQGGRLFLELRDRQSLAYQVGAYSLEGLDPGYVAIYLSCAPDKIEDAIRSIHTEIEDLLAHGVTPEELARSKHYLVGTHEIALQRRASVAAALAFHKAYGLDFGAHTQYAKRVDAVRNADVMRVIRRIFDLELAVTATVSPLAASPEAERRMRGVVRKTRKTPKARRTRGKRAGSKR